MAVIALPAPADEAEASSIGDALERAESEGRAVEDADVLPDDLCLAPELARRTLAAVENTLKEKGIAFSLGTFAKGSTGMTDAVQVQVDGRLPPSVQLFQALHIAGHAFQFGAQDGASRTRYFTRRATMEREEDRLQERRRFEQEATSYALRILEEAGAEPDVTSWFRTLSAIDFWYGARAYEQPQRDAAATYRNSVGIAAEHEKDWWAEVPSAELPTQRRAGRESAPYFAS